jgi:hypothetical protein
MRRGQEQEEQEQEEQEQEQEQQQEEQQQQQQQRPAARCIVCGTSSDETRRSMSLCSCAMTRMPQRVVVVVKGCVDALLCVNVWCRQVMPPKW